MAWTIPSDSDFDEGEPMKFGEFARQVRDNVIELASRESGTPWINGIGAIEIFTRELAGTLHSIPTPTYTNLPDLEGVWSVPDGVTRVDVTCVGGGGAGGGYNVLPSGYVTGSDWSGYGGCTVRAVLTVEPGEGLPYRIGAGGLPLAYYDGTDWVGPATHPQSEGRPGDGGPTRFGLPGNQVLAPGGGGGARGSFAGLDSYNALWMIPGQTLLQGGLGRSPPSFWGDPRTNDGWDFPRLLGGASSCGLSARTHLGGRPDMPGQGGRSGYLDTFDPGQREGGRPGANGLIILRY